ncbi:Alpha/Beta hydrolase protein [Bisporella sp. PMI_857]|nr:Alpha/Beta hydrolase protein [Bisporella sp. PMI_857]
MEATNLKHPKLGLIHGKSQGKVVQYLGLKYGNLEHPLGTATLCATLSTNPFDALHYGPSATQFPQSCEIEHTLIQHSLPIPKERTFSDKDCLNLNITMPSDTQLGDKLPVLVWIHGGGLCMGSNSWPQYDPSRLAAFASAQNLSTIIVSINYRLGIHGFATTEELRSKNFKPNNGLHDQRLALEWIKQNISGFGGDADNITALGQSAGAASASLHLLSDKPLFRRLICLGGSPLLIPALHFETAENLYARALANAEVGSETTSWSSNGQRPEEAKPTSSPMQPTFPTIDGDLIPEALTYAQLSGQNNVSLPGIEWCEEILVGCLAMESTIFESRLAKDKEFLELAFQRSLHTIFPEQKSTINTLLSDYGISIPGNIDTNRSYVGMVQFLQDLLFVAPVVALGRGCKKSYVFSLEEPNLWDGPSFGKPSHIFDVALLFQNYKEHLSQDQNTISEVFGLDVLKFVNGIAPWGTFEKTTEKVKTYCSRREKASGDDSSNLLERFAIIKSYIEDLGFEGLVQAWMELQMHIQFVARTVS